MTSFADISSDPETQRRLEEAYGDVDSLDAWVGMLAEDHIDGSTLGITATTIIAEQFTRLRDGDRFYYENVFSGRELRQIENTTLADVIERNTSIDFSRNANVFYASDDGITSDAPADRLAGPQPNGPQPDGPASSTPGPEQAQPRPPRNPAVTDQLFAAVAEDDDDDDDNRSERHRS